VTRTPYDRRVVLGLVLGGALAAALLGPRAMPLGATVACLGVAWALYRTWSARREERSVASATRRHWVDTLHGAQLVDAGGDAPLMQVHHGEQPLTIQVRGGGRRGPLAATITTLIGDRPVALRVWPVDAPAPPMDPSGATWSGPPIERAVLIEARLAGRLRCETSDEPFADQLLDLDVTAALLTVDREARGSFAGATYDGRRLGVHLAGPVVADPERSAALARVIWGAFLP
jgi:hypothetical protein